MQMALLFSLGRLSTVATKYCPKCEEDKQLSEFQKNKSTKDGLQSRCKVCTSETGKEYLRDPQKRLRKIEIRKKHYLKHKEKTVNVNLKRIYGITSEERAEILAQQNSACAICDKPESDFNCKLSVDHCHVTGKVRGLLCKKCNSGIGLLKDSVENLKKALAYLESK